VCSAKSHATVRRRRSTAKLRGQRADRGVEHPTAEFTDLGSERGASSPTWTPAPPRVNRRVRSVRSSSSWS